jgi:hypothetical protein
MITTVIWWACIAVEACILARGLKTDALSRFPFFYLYVASLFLADGSLYFVHLFQPSLYFRLNWDAGLLNLLLACGILLEIFRHVLLPYPGAERLARLTGLGIFGALFSVIGACVIVAPHVFQSRLMNTNLERNLTAVQAIFLACLLGIIVYYRIHLARDLMGMSVGYGLCLGLTLATLAVRIYAGPSFNVAWIYIQPFSYLLCLSIWNYTLWQPEPNPVPERVFKTGLDYDTFATATRGTVHAVRTSIGKAGRL